MCTARNVLVLCFCLLVGACRLGRDYQAEETANFRVMPATVSRITLDGSVVEYQLLILYDTDSGFTCYSEFSDEIEVLDYKHKRSRLQGVWRPMWSESFTAPKHVDVRQFILPSPADDRRTSESGKSCEP